jgi:hypothetical protein
MLENVIKKLEKEEVDFKLDDEKDALTINFGLELSFSTVNIEVSYDKNEKLYRFYSELVEFNDDSYEDGVELVNDINFNSLFLKAYLDDDNVLCIEYYALNDFDSEMFDELLNDTASLEELLEEYL